MGYSNGIIGGSNKTLGRNLVYIGFYLYFCLLIEPFRLSLRHLGVNRTLGKSVYILILGKTR